MESCKCRLCGGEAVFRFSKQILKKYNVGYFYCNQCESLQTEEPYWLDEAYADPRPIRDVWMASRNQKLQLLVYFTARIFGMSKSDKILDWGGGNGLLVRLLRDVGLDAYLFDVYSTNYYAVGFEYNSSQKYKMITAFEVWEHLGNPNIEHRKIFQHQPDLHLFSTQIYVGQDHNWDYLHPNSGKHVFFYSHKAIQYIATQNDYDVFISKNNKYSILSKNKLTQPQKRLLNLLFSDRKNQQRLINTVFYIAKKPNLTNTDFLNLENKGLI